MTTEAPRAVPFWCVRRMQAGLRQHGHFYRHATRDAAIAEAWRLAAKFLGARFVVLEAVHIALVDVREPAVEAEAQEIAA